MLSLFFNSKKIKRMQEEKRISNLEEDNKKNRKIVNEAMKWQDEMTKVHNPYVSGGNRGIDLSMSSTEDLKENFLKEIDRNLFCAHCRRPWPCETVGQLQQLQQILRYGDEFVPFKPADPTDGRIEVNY